MILTAREDDDNSVLSNSLSQITAELKVSDYQNSKQTKSMKKLGAQQSQQFELAA